MKAADKEPEIAVLAQLSEICVQETAQRKPVESLARQLLERMDVGNLTEIQRESLQQVMEKHEKAFSRTEDDIGYCEEVEHRIITTDEQPIKIAHRRIPPAQWPEVREYLRKALDRGVIRESSSPYASPVVLARKKDGSLRLC